MGENMAATAYREGIDPGVINNLVERYRHIAEFPGVSDDTRRALEKVREDLMKIIDTRDYR